MIDRIKFVNDDIATYENLQNFTQIMSDNGLPYVVTNNFVDAFKNLASYLDGKVIVIDEFQYLINHDSGILSDFQYIFDEILHFHNTTIIICGSTMGTVEQIGYNINSPLYGRFIVRMKLKPMTFSATRKFHSKTPFEQQILIYGAVGGTPLYHKYFKEDIGFIDNIASTFFNTTHPLYNEIEFLLRQELKDIATFSSILQAISNGKNKATEIANFAGMRVTDITRYLQTLRTLNLIRRVQPIDAKSNSKRSIYQIADNYFRFWFKFVSTNQNQIEFFIQEGAKSYLIKNLPTYMGHIIENIVIELFQNKYDRVGKWWYKNKEIDVVAMNNEKVVFIEIKWTNKKRTPNDLIELIKVSEAVHSVNDLKREYILISKSGFTNFERHAELKKWNYKLWTIKDLEREFDLIEKR